MFSIRHLSGLFSSLRATLLRYSSMVPGVMQRLLIDLVLAIYSSANLWNYILKTKKYTFLQIKSWSAPVLALVQTSMGNLGVMDESGRLLPAFILVLLHYVLITLFWCFIPGPSSLMGAHSLMWSISIVGTNIFVPQVFPLLCTFPYIHPHSFSNLCPGFFFSHESSY